MRRSTGSLLLFAGWLLAACGGPLYHEQTDGIGRAQLLSGEALFGSQIPPPLPDVNILAVDATMQAFVDAFVDRRATGVLRLHQLVYAVISDGSFGLEYTESTRTAAQTFAARNGNCLAFTSMFVAMARAAGLDARFQQIDIPPDWEQHGDTLVLNRHINVLVDLGIGGKKAVDFNIDDFKASYDRTLVSDGRAAAHYYSNLGVEQLQARDNREAFRYLRKGLDVDGGFSPLWTNLGALYRRNDLPRHAEASYLEALRVDKGDMVATSNLARLYAELGDETKAEAYRAIARNHRRRNPYYRFHQAREAFLQRDYAASLKHLDYAIRKKPMEDAFYFLRGMNYLQLGQEEQARQDLERAETLAADAQLKRNYHSKMEMLLGEQE